MVNRYHRRHMIVEYIFYFLCSKSTFSFVHFGFSIFFLPFFVSSKEKNAKTKASDKSKNLTKETSLRERAVAKLKILNFNINWDMHVKPCG